MPKRNGETVGSRILAVLSDGQRHSREELRRCLNDDLASFQNMRQHLSDLRKVLRPRGEDILCEVYYHEFWYRHVRLLASATDGKR